MPQIPFIGPSYQGRSMDFDASRCVNFFPELAASGDAKSIASLVGTYGTSAFKTGFTMIRGLHSFNGLLYFVDNDKFNEVTAAGTVTTRGTLTLTVAILDPANNNPRRVQMMNNGITASGVGGNQILIIDKPDAYIYNISTHAFTQINTAGAGPGNSSYGTYIDGYFVTCFNGTSTAAGSLMFPSSNLFDGTTWNALAVAPVESTPEVLQAVVAHHQQLWCIKENTTEIYYDTGTATDVGSPFARISGAVLNYGTEAPDSISLGDNALFMLASQRNGQNTNLIGVVRFDGYNPTLVMPQSLVYRINQFAHDPGNGGKFKLADSFGFCYSEEGHTFYQLTFPSAGPTDANGFPLGATFVYDTTTQLWHERCTFTNRLAPFGTYATGMHLANSYAYFNNRHYVGEQYGVLGTGAAIWQQSAIFLTDGGQNIRSWRTSPCVFDRSEKDNFFISKLMIDMEKNASMDSFPGVGAVPIRAVTVDIVNGLNYHVICKNGNIGTQESTDAPTAPLYIADLSNSKTYQLISTNGDIGFQEVSGFLPTSLYFIFLDAVNGLYYKMVSNNGDIGTEQVNALAYQIIDPATVPQVSLSWSNDSGRTWSSEDTRDMTDSAIWRRLGYGRGKVFRLTMADAIKKVVMAVYAKGGK